MPAFEYLASDGKPLIINVSENNVHITDSYRIKDDAEKKLVIDITRLRYPSIWEKRTIGSLMSEWKAHNALYRHNLLVSHTKDVDLESKQSLFLRIAYFLVSRMLGE